MENLDNHDTEKSDTFSKQEQDATLVVSKTDFKMKKIRGIDLKISSTSMS